jgi:hypothetical protein
MKVLYQYTIRYEEFASNGHSFGLQERNVWGFDKKDAEKNLRKTVRLRIEVKKIRQISGKQIINDDEKE